jgi:uncharacterized protein (TIGR00251 family)
MMGSVAVRIQLRVSPGAKRTAVAGRHGDGWKVRVAAPPEGGRANAELLRHLAGLLGVDRRAVRVVSGAHSRDKVVEVDGVAAAAVTAALGAG